MLGRNDEALLRQEGSGLLPIRRYRNYRLRIYQDWSGCNNFHDWTKARKIIN